MIPGEEVTVFPPDGRDVSGKVLGTNWLSDVALVKITDRGPWPHVALVNSVMMKPDTPCFVLGYPWWHESGYPSSRRFLGVLQTRSCNEAFPSKSITHSVLRCPTRRGS